MKRTFTVLLSAGIVFLLTTIGEEARGSWTFKDSAGKLIPFAKVVVYRGDVGSSEMEEYRSYFLDKEGRCPEVRLSEKYSYYAVLEHPDYGVQRVTLSPRVKRKAFHIYAVQKGTDAYERSIRGYLLDDANNPVVGASMSVRIVNPPGGITAYVEGRVYTDENGWFHLYPLIYADSKAKIGNWIPHNSCYSVRIEVPREAGLAPAMMCISNKGEQIVRLRERGYFHTFAFEDADGRIADAKVLERFELTVSNAAMDTIKFEYGQFEAGRVLPTGTYWVSDWRRDYEFEPMEVTAESPEELVFRTKHDFETVTYVGRVVHGITGKPMEGAFVIAEPALNIMRERNLSEIRPAEWDLLYGLAVNPSADDPALKSLGNTFTSTRIVRTNSRGQYRVVSEPKRTINYLAMFEKDFLGVRLYTHGYEPSKDGRVQIPVVPLFPAARVQVDLAVASKGSIYGVQPRWLIDPNKVPEWAREPQETISYEGFMKADGTFDVEALFAESAEDANRAMSFWELYGGGFRDFTYDEFVPPNRMHTFYIPAGVELNVMFYAHQDTKNEWIPVVTPKALNLKQGELIDLGKYELKRSMAVVVKVTDVAGNPVEGIPVGNSITAWSGPKNTDAKGRATFNVYPYSKVEFSVSCERHNLREAISYDVGGEEDSGREFVLVVSDDLIAHFLRK
jgi:hypothetical protein